MGSDYRKADKSALGFSVNATHPANTTQYKGIGSTNNNPDRISLPLPWDGVLSILQAHAGAAPGVGETFTYTVMINGLATALTCQTVNPNQDSSDLVNAVAVVQGDRVEIRIASSLNAGVTYHTASVGYTT